MKAVVQRVVRASVTVDGQIVGQIERGLMILLGVTHGDTEAQAAWLAQKIARLRIFEDAEGKMNLSLLDVGGGALVVSQFTLYGDCRKGNRPSFTDAAESEIADALYEQFAALLAQAGISPIQTGVFGAHMQVEIHNDGPVTLILER
ncbi:MAG: D-tyrosyl-tRNA(Tyr) deacylase [Anaerolineae bacterium]|nr:D-tyrosyl-tRNA(Tyr) deacylase [Anaerolineae bacterium]